MKSIIVGTAGHIDHGKSALVEALTGTNPDRLEEEKRRGITIDLGFAFLTEGDYRFGFVDVPGHERFVRNMLAGVGGIDLVLLVIAADEGIKPQTREHFDICRLLEIPRGLAVITKSDLADPAQLELVRMETEEFLRGSFLEGAPIVAVSAKTGAGLAALKSELVRAAGSVPARDPSRYFRLPIDRVFAMKGFGTVVTGTLLSGSIAPEQEAELFPSRRRVRVRGVQSGGQAVPRAEAGQRTALNLAGVEQQEVQRGMVLATPGLFEPSRCVEARLKLLPSARPLKNHARVHFHQGTAECIAEVVLFERAQLEPGESGYAQLRLSEELLLLPRDRFIVRQFSPVVTIGGGAVLAPLAPRRSRLSPHARALLESWERGERGEILSALLAAAREAGQKGGLSLAQIVARSGWTPEDARAVARELEAAKSACLLSSEGGRVVAADEFDACMARMAAEVERFHAANPLSPGIAREELRRRVAGRAEESAMFAAALEQMLRSGHLVAVGERVKRAGREVELSAEEQRAREEIEAAFARAGLRVPATKEVLARLPVEEARAQKILALLVREQVLVKVTEELVFHRQALARLRELLAQYKRERGERISVPAFKELTGITRKYAIPLLEYLDRNGVTRRAGDNRLIL